MRSLALTRTRNGEIRLPVPVRDGEDPYSVHTLRRLRPDPGIALIEPG